MADALLSTWLVILIVCILCVLLSAIFGAVIFILWKNKQKKKLTSTSISFHDSNHNDVELRDEARKRDRPTISVCTPGRVGAILHVVRYAFKPYRHNHLNLTIGQIVQVLGESFIGENGEDWFLGTIDDKLEGIFPCDVVVKMALSATKRSLTPNREQNAYETNTYDVIDDSSTDNRDAYNNYMNQPLTKDNVTGIVNQIFSISDESSHLKEVDGVIYGNVGEARRHASLHRLSLNSNRLSSRPESNASDHCSLDVDIPVRNEMGVYEEDARREPICYENVSSIKRGTYFDNGESLDIAIKPIENGDDEVFQDESKTIQSFNKAHVVDNDTFDDLHTENNTYDVIDTDDINHYDEIFIDDQVEKTNEHKWYVAVSSFTPKYDGQLALRPGDQLIIVGSEAMDVSVDDGETWMTGESLTTGMEGCFPRRCVVAMTDKIDSRSSKPKYIVTQDATSSYETIYDHRDPLVVARNLEGHTLPDLVNNTTNERNGTIDHLYGNIQVLGTTMDSTDDSYMTPVKSRGFDHRNTSIELDNARPSLNTVPDHHAPDLPSNTYDELPYSVPFQAKTSSPSSTNHSPNPNSNYVNQNRQSNSITPMKINPRIDLPIYNRSISTISTSSAISSSNPSRNSQNNLRLDKNGYYGIDDNDNVYNGIDNNEDPLYDTPPKPLIPIKPKRNSVVLSVVADLSINRSQTPPPKSLVSNNANNNTVSPPTNADYSSTLAEGMSSLSHVNAPFTNHLTSEDSLSTSSSNSKMSSMKLLTAMGYAKPRPLPKSSEEIMSRVESISPSNTPAFYKRTAGAVRPLKFSPIRFSPKSTPTKDQSFDFIDVSTEYGRGDVSPSVDVIPVKMTNGQCVAAELNHPPALPTSPPPEM